MERCAPALDPAALPYPPKRGKGGLPAVLHALSDALGDYVFNPMVLPSLNIANGSARQQRSERRVACVRLMRSALAYLDLVSLRVGIPVAGGQFKGYNQDAVEILP